MTINELGNELKKMYEKAENGEKVTKIILFGILYKNEIKKFNNDNKTLKKICKIAGISDKYPTEIRKGMNLAKYVKYKDL